MDLIKKIKLNTAEKISIVYAIATGFFTIIFGAKEGKETTMTAFRFLFVFAMLALSYINYRYNNKITWFIRSVFPLTLIAYWYPETYFLNENIFQNCDLHFIHIDQIMFGCQPSIEFSRAFPQSWISELMNFGYLSYYFIIAGAVFISLKAGKKNMEKSIFIILCSFFLYYILFIIIPVEGPQFYFTYPENSIPNQGILRGIIVFLQDLGEKPTGAFPSSHVGICLICMYVIFGYSKKLFAILLPISIVLICSTVYIKAHYLIDVIGGIVSAPIFYFVGNKIYKTDTSSVKYAKNEIS